MLPNSDFYNCDEIDICAARTYYSAAILLSNTPCRFIVEDSLELIVQLLDKALQYAPDFLDADYLRQEIWHKILKPAKATPGNPGYQNYLRSPAWDAKKKQVLERDGDRCAFCNANATEVHHKTYENIGKEPLTDLTSLCRSCHQRYENDKQHPQLSITSSPSCDLYATPPPAISSDTPSVFEESNNEEQNVPFDPSTPPY